MSELLEKNPEDYEGYDPVERPVLKREFAAEFTEGDGRTVSVRVIPYGESAEVSDDGRTSYREEWMPGCFDDQLRAANRVDVLMNFEHERGIGGLVGRGTELHSLNDGLHGTFRIFDGQDGDKALELIHHGVLGGVSLEAYAKKSVRAVDGTVRRMRAHLDKVSLCRRPAFKGAIVLAVREEIILDESMLPIEMDTELIDRCRRLGIKLPQQYEAHLAETDTPDLSGTSESDTRPVVETATSEEPT